MKPIDRKPGDPMPTIIDVSEEFGEGALLIAPKGPDWVLTPPELGRLKLYFKDRYRMTMTCPNCKVEDVDIIVAEFRDSKLFCFETLDCCKQFVWANCG
jgi:hypothetical protein